MNEEQREYLRTIALVDQAWALYRDKEREYRMELVKMAFMFGFITFLAGFCVGTLVTRITG